MHFEWFFVYLEFIVIHLKLHITFLRPFDNFEILLVSSCHRFFFFIMAVKFCCIANLWNKTIRTRNILIASIEA